MPDCLAEMMEAISPQGELFPFLEARRDLHQVKFWLVVPEAPEMNRFLNVLLERRHVIIEPINGASPVNCSDVILLLDVHRQQMLGLGSEYLAGFLPPDLLRLGLAYWLGDGSDSSIIPLAGQRAALSCVAFEFRPGRSPPLSAALRNRNLIGRLLTELRHGAQRAPGNAQAYLEGADQDTPDNLRGLLLLEAGAAMLRNASALSNEDLACARQFFQRASNHLASAGHRSALSASHSGVERTEQLIFERRQYSLDLNDLWMDPERHTTPALMGYRMHTIYALPLPPVRLTVDTGKMRHLEQERRILFRTKVTATLLRRLLGTTGGRSLVPSVRTPREARGGNTSQPKLVVGSELRLTALLDDELHQLAHVASRSGEETVLVEAYCTSMRVTPQFRETRIGHPVHFGLKGQLPGRHEIRFTFLTRIASASRVERTIHITAE